MANDLGACGGSGWTLVMKIDGNKVEMGYFIVCFANLESLALQNVVTMKASSSDEFNMPYRVVSRQIKF